MYHAMWPTMNGICLRTAASASGPSDCPHQDTQVCLRTKSGAKELYDLVNDPLEMDNLYNDASVRAVQKELEWI